LLYACCVGAPGARLLWRAGGCGHGRVPLQIFRCQQSCEGHPGSGSVHVPPSTAVPKAHDEHPCCTGLGDGLNTLPCTSCAPKAPPQPPWQGPGMATGGHASLWPGDRLELTARAVRAAALHLAERSRRSLAPDSRRVGSEDERHSPPPCHHQRGRTPAQVEKVTRAFGDIERRTRRPRDTLPSAHRSLLR